MYFPDFQPHSLVRALVVNLLMTLLVACGGGSGGSVTVLPGTPTLNNLPATPTPANALAVSVDTGPAGTGYNVNRLYTDVTVCYPGKSSPGSATQCQTIDHVLVDTGSTGLRLLASALAPALSLNRLTNTAGLPLINCAQFLDNSFAWGPVVAADLVLAGQKAASVPIQVIADPDFNAPATDCAGGGTHLTTADLLGANGIIGLGLNKEDCGATCVTTRGNGYYYTCTNGACSGTVVSLSKQVKNPVPLFTSNNNGVLVNLPAADPAGSATLSGTLIFGLGTQSNNQLTSGAVLTTDGVGHVSTQLGARTYTGSFFDTGSNGLFFDASVPVCVGSNTGFYCPASSQNLSASVKGVNAASRPVTFSVGNATQMFASGVNTVLPNLAGPIGKSVVFDWGLPFFYGRRVMSGIEGQPATLGGVTYTGPFYAF